MDGDFLQRLCDLQSPCRLCPRQCGVKRQDGEAGFCGTLAEPVIASYGAHYGEESVLVGAGGSGTIFLSGCNLKCVFCQNYDISHSAAGQAVTCEGLADIMLRLDARGVENINFVTPTHNAPQVAEAVMLARERGLRRPVVYNCGGYESVEALRGLEGIVDIYMPDAKFLNGRAAARYLGAADYPSAMRAALAEMHRQVGDLDLAGGRAVRGLLVRHLVMPGMTDDSKRIMDFLAREISPDTFVNVMGQYRPCFRADGFPEIDRRVSLREVEEVREYAVSMQLRLAD